jgi:hypothetical protein
MEFLMKNLLTATSLSILAVLSSQVEARTIVSADTRCFQIGDVIPGGWDRTLKIKMQQALSDKPGQIVHVDALELGFKATNPPIQYANQLTGSATIAPPNDQLPGGDQLQISLVGTSYGNREDISKNGVFSFDYALRLDPKTLAGPITGYQIFTPFSNGQIDAPISQAPLDTQLQPISCEGR